MKKIISTLAVMALLFSINTNAQQEPIKKKNKTEKSSCTTDKKMSCCAEKKSCTSEEKSAKIKCCSAKK